MPSCFNLQINSPSERWNVIFQPNTFVADRPGTIFAIRLMIKNQTELKWLPKVSFEKAIETTVTHYLDQYLYQKSQ